MLKFILKDKTFKLFEVSKSEERVMHLEASQKKKKKEEL
jgi:hypothetical protein